MILKVNGQTCQDARSSDMTWDIATLIRFVDERSSFERCDVLFTGSRRVLVRRPSISQSRRRCGSGDRRDRRPAQCLRAAPTGFVMTQSVAGKRIVATGGAAGIGAIALRAFVTTGARVVSLDINETALPEGTRHFGCDVATRVATFAAFANAAAWMDGLVGAERARSHAHQPGGVRAHASAGRACH